MNITKNDQFIYKELKSLCDKNYIIIKKDYLSPLLKNRMIT